MRISYLLTAALLINLLGACGNKGPLSLPPKGVAQAIKPPSPQSAPTAAQASAVAGDHNSPATPPTPSAAPSPTSLSTSPPAR